MLCHCVVCAFITSCNHTPLHLTLTLNLPHSRTHNHQHAHIHLIDTEYSSTFSIAELDALGDDFLADEDTSYLDDSVKAPEPPTTVPGGTERTRVRTAHMQAMAMRSTFVHDMSLFVNTVKPV